MKNKLAIFQLQCGAPLEAVLVRFGITDPVQVSRLKQENDTIDLNGGKRAPPGDLLLAEFMISRGAQVQQTASEFGIQHSDDIDLLEIAFAFPTAGTDHTWRIIRKNCQFGNAPFAGSSPDR